MGLLDFLTRRPVPSQARARSLQDPVTINLAGRPVFSLDTHLANCVGDFDLPDVPKRVDRRLAWGWAPKNDSVFVYPLQESDRSVGGIITPDRDRQRPQMGVVLAKGAGLWDAEMEKLIPIECEVGDLVTYNKFSGQAFELDGIEILIVRNVELQARKFAGTYTLTMHHVDEGGLSERRVYHEPHMRCEHCPKPESELIAEERARLVAESNEGLGLAVEPLPLPPDGHEDFVPYEAGVKWYYALTDDHGGDIVKGPYKTEIAAAHDAASAREERANWVPEDEHVAEQAVADLRASARVELCEVPHPEFAVITCLRSKDHEGDEHRGVDHTTGEDVYYTATKEVSRDKEFHF